MHPNATYPACSATHRYNDQYPYIQPPPAPCTLVAQTNTCKWFARAVALSIVFLFGLSFLSSVITYVSFKPKVPEFYLSKIYVSNFNTSANPFRANWDTNFTAINPNQNLRAYFDKIWASVFYHEHELCSILLTPIVMDVNTNTTMRAVISASSVAENVVSMMSKDQESGSLTFVLFFKMTATFKYGVWFTRSMDLLIFCDKLKVKLVGSSGSGTLVHGAKSCKLV